MRLVAVSLVSLLLLSAAGASAEGFGHDLWLGRSRIGVQVQSMTPELRAFLEAPEDRGVLVVRVLADSPAQAAGLQVGDVITVIGEHQIGNLQDFSNALKGLEAGQTVQVTVLREGAEVTVPITVEAR